VKKKPSDGGLLSEPAHDAQEDNARNAAAEAAIKAIERSQHELGQQHANTDLYAATGAKVMEPYRARITNPLRSDQDAERMRLTNEIERELRLAGLRAERDELYRLGRTRRLSAELVRKLVREVDLIEAQLISI
jgi:monovalent cation/hydrogen antiporter